MRKIKNKKAQMKIQQMAFMLMAVILFFILVGLFWLGMKYADLGKKAKSLEQEKSMSLALTLAESPEFSCGGRSYCIDADKILLLKNKPTYSQLWPVSKIEVRKIYPALTSNIECNLGNYPNCNFYTIYDNKEETQTSSSSSHVRLCKKEKTQDYTYTKCELGEIIVKI